MIRAALTAKVYYGMRRLSPPPTGQYLRYRKMMLVLCRRRRSPVAHQQMSVSSHAAGVHLYIASLK